MPKTFNDPLFQSQWYLLNTGQRGGTARLDINVMSAWDRYSGKGVIVAVNDDGQVITTWISSVPYVQMLGAIEMLKIDFGSRQKIEEEPDEW